MGTRVGENSKIILDGDYKQAIGNNSNTNPLVRMCNELKGNDKFACIYLDEDDPVILVGATEAYEPRCRCCHMVLKRDK